MTFQMNEKVNQNPKKGGFRETGETKPLKRQAIHSKASRKNHNSASQNVLGDGHLSLPKEPALHLQVWFQQIIVSTGS